MSWTLGGFSPVLAFESQGGLPGLCQCGSGGNESAAEQCAQKPSSQWPRLCAVLWFILVAVRHELCVGPGLWPLSQLVY
eukprot:7391305-Prymnesium_polylepis.1